jgi:N6-L-threonylcarbamoyladenine synthase
MIILGIETSCDETAAAVVRADKDGISVVSNVVSSQVKLHSRWGGVVPNLAAREHLKNILPVIGKALKEAGVKLENIDLMAVTIGPGLIPALLIGVNAAKTLSYTTKKPLLGIHHIEGHIYANFIPHGGSTSIMEVEPPIKFPVLCLVVSGGHTQLILMKKHLDYEIIGETLDDAAGEAFDKVARILGLGYPGGPIISQLSAKWTSGVHSGRPVSIPLPRPMINSKNLNFSFSGLKTAVLYAVKKNPDLVKDKKYVVAMCHEFQQAVIDVLVQKTIIAAKKFQPKTIMLAGGVSANNELRKQLGDKIKKELKNISYIIPDIPYSVDNAAMIAIAGYFRHQAEKKKEKLLTNWKTVEADANLKL